MAAVAGYFFVRATGPSQLHHAAIAQAVHVESLKPKANTLFAENLCQTPVDHALAVPQGQDMPRRVGLITLIGLITKHGILMVEFANQQREDHGLAQREAIVSAAKTRLRPILMTTAAMALAVVPLIIAEGAGAAARQAMGLVIFTGLLIGTIFTLFVVPTFYTLIARSDANHLLHKLKVERQFGNRSAGSAH